MTNLIKNSETRNFSRKDVIRREAFLRNAYKPGVKFCEVGKEAYLRNEKAGELLIDLINRYPLEKELKAKPFILTHDNITSNGKYSLD